MENIEISRDKIFEIGGVEVRMIEIKSLIL